MYHHANSSGPGSSFSERTALCVAFSVAGVLIGVGAIIGAARMEPGTLTVNAGSGDGGACPTGTVLETVYYKVPSDDMTQYKFVDNSKYFSSVATTPMTSPDGSKNLPDSYVFYRSDNLKEAGLFSEDLLINQVASKVAATLSYMDNPDGSTTQVGSNRFSVTSGSGSWRNAKFLDIMYDNDSGVRTVKVVC